MTLGGRPPEDEGHEAKNLSLDRESKWILSLVKTNCGKQSTFVERAIKELAAKKSFSFMFLKEKESGLYSSI
jgi:hypothetical protein